MIKNRTSMLKVLLISVVSLNSTAGVLHYFKTLENDKIKWPKTIINIKSNQDNRALLLKELNRIENDETITLGFSRKELLTKGEKIPATMEELDNYKNNKSYMTYLNDQAQEKLNSEIEAAESNQNNRLKGYSAAELRGTKSQPRTKRELNNYDNSNNSYKDWLIAKATIEWNNRSDITTKISSNDTIIYLDNIDKNAKNNIDKIKAILKDRNGNYQLNDDDFEILATNNPKQFKVIGKGNYKEEVIVTIAAVKNLTALPNASLQGPFNTVAAFKQALLIWIQNQTGFNNIKEDDIDIEINGKAITNADINGIDAKKLNITINAKTGNRPYTGSKTINVTIKANIKNHINNGKSDKTLLTDNASPTPEEIAYYLEKEKIIPNWLRKGIDYQITYSDQIITIKGKDNYHGEVPLSYTTASLTNEINRIENDETITLGFSRKELLTKGEQIPATMEELDNYKDNKSYMTYLNDQAQEKLNSEIEAAESNQNNRLKGYTAAKLRGTNPPPRTKSELNNYLWSGQSYADFLEKGTIFGYRAYLNAGVYTYVIKDDNTVYYKKQTETNFKLVTDISTVLMPLLKKDSQDNVYVVSNSRYNGHVYKIFEGKKIEEVVRVPNKISSLVITRDNKIFVIAGEHIYWINNDNRFVYNNSFVYSGLKKGDVDELKFDGAGNLYAIQAGKTTKLFQTKHYRTVINPRMIF